MVYAIEIQEYEKKKMNAAVKQDENLLKNKHRRKRSSHDCRLIIRYSYYRFKILWPT